jgi:predicted short-subunit dehydrogenase-like oxidoreductase (DUF2520 family)
VTAVAIVGAGRVGLSLARALRRSGGAVVVLGRQARQLPDGLGPLCTEWGPALSTATVVIVAVPDDMITAVATQLLHTDAIAPRQVVLHTSGLHDRSALAGLNGTGAALGSLHPLQTFVLRDGEPDLVASTPAVIEGDARALTAAREIAESLGMQPIVTLTPEHKAAYHAGAVFAGNYPVVLAAIATKLARDAGAGSAAATLYLPLMRRALENAATGTGTALSGPISRGDAGTVARHLDLLTGLEREIYVALGKEALVLARAAGLDSAAASKIETLLY